MTLDVTPERPPLTVVPDPDHRPHTDTTRETEQAILGAAITAPRLIPTIAAILTSPDYHHPEHQTIWDAITTLHDTGQPIDPITVADRLTRDATLHRAGGHLYLFDCVAACTVPANAPVWAQIVADNATRRRLADTAARITQAAALGMDPATITDHARAALDSLTAATTRTTTHTPADLLPDLIDRLDNPAIAGLPTPWPDLDRHIHGLQPGHLYIVGARPSVGKSLMAQAIAVHVALDKRRYGLPVKMGALLGTRSYRPSQPVFVVAQPLLIRAKMLLRDESGMGAYDCSIESAGQCLALATLKVYEPEDFRRFVQGK